MDKMGRTHLVIPDAHDHPGIDQRRFDWLGQIILDIRPDVIICLGDFADMESLCSYDKGTKGYEGRRYQHDIKSAKKAMKKVMKPLNDYNKKAEDNHKSRYRPEFHLCLGNHEHRINRCVDFDPILDGTISTDDLAYDKAGWKVHPFLDEVVIDGVTYSHYFASGVMGRPISGEHPATTLINKQHRSCTAGHSHLADWSQRRRGDKHIMGCVGGCFFEHDEGYVPTSVNQMYWRGLIIKRNVVDGCYDPEFYSMNSIKKKYLK